MEEGQPWQFKWIWRIDMMPKIKIFFWKMCHNSLPVRWTLLRRGCCIKPQCPLCLDDIETTDRLFGGCPRTCLVWELAIQHKWIPQQAQPNHTQDWIQFCGTLKIGCNGTILQRISLLLWSVWKARNAVIFQNECFHHMKCLIRAQKLSAEFRIRTCMW